jgi:hypothetical protein
VETNIANGPEMTNGGQGGLENEDVFVVNFKWGSMVALGLVHGTTIYFDHWDPADVVWVNSGFAGSINTNYTGDETNGYFGNFLGYGGADISAARLDAASRADGHGDICEELTNGAWRYPSGPVFQTTEEYARVNAPTGTNHPFGYSASTIPVRTSWSVARSSNDAITYWRDVSQNTATGLAGSQIAPHIPIGLFGLEGQAVSDGQDFFLPAAGGRTLDLKNLIRHGTSSGPGQAGMYWTSASVGSGTGRQGYSVIFSHAGFGSSSAVNIREQMSVHYSLPVRCVTVGPE